MTSPEHARLAADLEEARAKAAMHRREAARLRRVGWLADAIKHIERARDQEQIALGIEDEIAAANKHADDCMCETCATFCSMCQGLCRAGSAHREYQTTSDAHRAELARRSR